MNSQCIIFQGFKDSAGYGHTTHGGKKLSAHRKAWLIANGDIPPGMVVCHKCDNPSCINPDHLFIGTHADNARDRDSKGRGRTRISKGPNSPFAALKKAERESKRAAGYVLKQVWVFPEKWPEVQEMLENLENLEKEDNQAFG